ncbi:MAG: response regulator transcription factor [Vicinamibacterales bacterium]
MPGPASDARRVLVVEDEPHIRELVRLHLGLEGLEVTEAADGDAGLRLIREQDFDLLILDLMLPGLDGLALCRATRGGARNTDVPILMLTARREESDKVVGLESGADDYLTKPFGIRELVARARALLRRPRASKAAAPTPDVIAAGPIAIDRARREVHVDGRPVDLTPHEFEVLSLLASEPGVVFSRETLLERIWSNDVHVTSRSVDTLIKRLRQKIEPDTRDPRLVLTVWGTGYKLADG